MLGTVTDDAWLNAVQEALAHPIEHSGGVLTKGDNTQLTTAIKALAALAVQAGAYAVDSSGAANVIVVNPTPAVAALVAGDTISVKVANTNTGATTLNVSGLGATAVAFEGAALVAGQIIAGSIFEFEYDGVKWDLVSPPVPTTIPSATTGQAGIVALATRAQAQAGSDTSHAVTPDALAGAIQSGALTYAVDTSGAANAITIAMTPAVAAYSAGMVVTFKVANTNTGATTIAVNGLAAEALTYGGSALAANQLKSGQIYSARFDGAAFQLQTPATTGTYFESAEMAIAGGSSTLAHGLGIKPSMVQAYVRCKVASSGHSVGAEIPVNTDSGYQGGNTKSYGGCAWAIDATYCGYWMGNDGVSIPSGNSSGTALATAGNFVFFLRARL